MALGSLALPDTNVGFDAEGTAMVPVSAGRSKLGEIKIKSPLDTFKDTFFSMQESLAAMLGIQTKEAKRQAFIDEKLLAQKDFEIRKMNEKFAEENRQGPLQPTSDDFKGVDTDKKRKTNIEAFEGSALAGILGTLQESFDKVSFGEKMTALLLTGGLAFVLTIGAGALSLYWLIVSAYNVYDPDERCRPKGYPNATFADRMLPWRSGIRDAPPKPPPKDSDKEDDL